MRRFRRSRWAAYFHEDAVVVDIRALLSGELAARPATNIIAASALTGAEAAVSPDELALVSTLQTDEWTNADDLGADAEVAERLAERGLVVADDDDGPLAELRARDEKLTNEQWDRYAALFHFMDRGRGEAGVTVEEADRLKAGFPVEGSPVTVEDARQVAYGRAASFVDEIRSSLEFYTAQSPRARITRVLVTGGGSKLRGFVELLQERLTIPVDRAHPFQKVLANKDVDQQAEALLAVAIGLAIPGGVR